MRLQRHPGSTSLTDLLDRIINKGLVIDTWQRVSIAGIDLSPAQSRVVVASTDPSLKNVDAVDGTTGRTRRGSDDRAAVDGSPVTPPRTLPTRQRRSID